MPALRLIPSTNPTTRSRRSAMRITLDNPPPSSLEQHLSAWELPEVEQRSNELEKITALFNTCRYEAHIAVGMMRFKPQRFTGSLPGGLIALAGACKCGGANRDPYLPVRPVHHLRADEAAEVLSTRLSRVSRKVGLEKDTAWLERRRGWRRRRSGPSLRAAPAVVPLMAGMKV